MPDSFVHLHAHSEYSILDGASRVDATIKKAAEDGMPAMGLTDHGVMYGVAAWVQACNKYGIGAIIGEELYMSDDRKVHPKRKTKRKTKKGAAAVQKSNEEEVEGGGKAFHHLTALAENKTGYNNLIKLSSRAFLEGFYYKPRVDWELLEQHKDGLIVTTGCLGGMTLQALLAQDYEKARQITGRMKDIFGPEHLFVELQDHGIPEQDQTNPRLLDLAKDLGLPLLLTNDSHYVDQADHVAHGALLCVQTGSLMSDPNRFKFHGDQHYVKTAAEMRRLFPDHPEACDNTLWIAERCDVDIADPDPKLPKFPLPEGHQMATEYLTELVEAGARRRWGDTVPPAILERLTFELGVIDDMGFPDYFLIVWDLVEYAKSKGARVGPGRGSAAGCAVAYCLGITEIDPIKYDLLFERFLNPSRVSMPDIDLDIDTRFRDEWIRYTREKYGDDRVCQVITFSRIKSRAAVRDSARVMGKSYDVGDRLVKSLPPLMMGRDTPLAACLELDDKHEEGYNRAGDFRALYHADPENKEVVDVAIGLEGLRRQDGIHAAAVVISDRPLTDILPIQQKPDPKNPDPPIVSQYDMHAVEDLGLLKMDFLGLRNLDVISDTIDMIREIRGVELDIDNLPMDDEDTYVMLRGAHTVGVFQLECVSGRTLVSGRRVDELFRDQEAGHPKGRTLSVYLDEGKTHFNRIVRIVHSGVKPLYRLRTASGRFIEATDNHVFMTADGWKRLGDVVPHEDTVLVHQTAKTLIYRECVDCGAQTNADSHKASDRCYPCSARYHSNPSKPHSRSAISAAARQTYGDGRRPWNKGLTVETSDTMQATGRKIAGALQGRTWEDLHGVERAAELRRRSSARMSGTGNHMFGKTPPHSKGGHRPDLGHYVRSSWEADVARVLRYLDEPYEYEAHKFTLTRSDGTPVTYTPDFYLTSHDSYVEVKGFMRHEDREKLDLFAEQYPDKTLVLIDTVAFAEYQLMFKDLVAWECPRIPTRMDWEEVIEVCRIDPDDTYDIMMEAPAHNYLANGFMVHNSGGMKALIHRLQPTSFDDLGALVALYRPGPMDAGMHNEYADRKNARKKVEYLHDDASEYLGYTFGIMLYQEQMMRIAEKFAGYTLAESDNLRKACGKKLPELMAKEESKFIQGCVDTGYGAELGTKWFDLVRPFADYSFNRCIVGSTRIQQAGTNMHGDGTMAIEEFYSRAYPELPPAGNRNGGYVGPCVRCETKEAKRRGLCNTCAAWLGQFRRGEKQALALNEDGRLTPAPIKDVHYNGVQPVWTVTLSNGSSITATANHRHMTPEGWKMVADLAAGDSLLVDGGYEAHAYTPDENRTTVGDRQRVGTVAGAFGSDNYGYVDGGFARLQEWTKTAERVCVDCGHDGSVRRLERAHLDGDRTNNEPVNLAMKCVSCHKKHDYRENGRRRRWEKGHIATAVEIVSIGYAGMQETYDLEMASPDHNFVANGIVTHNSHAYAYGLIAYHTAYLKTHYPTEYMAALLTSVMDNQDKIRPMLNECRRLGIKVLPPNVNQSRAAFTVVQDEGEWCIAFGMAAIAGIGTGWADVVSAEREANGPYKDFYDFCLRVEIGSLNKGMIEKIVKAGGFELLGHPRKGLLMVFEQILTRAIGKRKKEAFGQFELFAELAPEAAFDEVRVPIPNEDYDKQGLLAVEREMLGLYISDHPLVGAEFILKRQAPDTIEGLLAQGHDAVGTVGGLVTDLKRKITKKGDPMGVFTLEDLGDTVETVVFPRTYRKFGDKLGEDTIVIMECKVDARDEKPKLIADKLRVVNVTERPDAFEIRTDGAGDILPALKELLLSHPGYAPVVLHTDAGKLALPDEYGVDVGDGLKAALRVLIGPWALSV